MEMNINQTKIQLFLSSKHDNISLNKIDKIIDIMPKERILKYNKLIKNESKINCFLGYFLLLYALKKNKITNNAQSFKYSQNKKPKLAFTNKISFNISHTKNLVALAISKKSVGLDVETINKDKIKSIKKICCEEEYLKFLKSANKEKMFFKIWTKKESYCKLKGISIFDNLLKINTLNLKNIKTFFFENNAISVSCGNNFKLKTIVVDCKNLL